MILAIDIIISLLAIGLICIQLKYFDDNDLESKYYLLLFFGSLIPFVNLIILLTFVIYFIVEKGSSLLDNYRYKNKNYKIKQQENYIKKYRKLCDSLIKSEQFKDYEQINDFINGIDVFNKLNENEDDIPF